MPASETNGVDSVANNGINTKMGAKANPKSDSPISLDYLHIFDSRTKLGHNIPIHNNFVKASDLSTVCAPDAQDSQRIRKLSVLDIGFQHTACKESGITLMYISSPFCDLWIETNVHSQVMEKRASYDFGMCGSRICSMTIISTPRCIS